MIQYVNCKTPREIWKGKLIRNLQQGVTKNKGEPVIYDDQILIKDYTFSAKMNIWERIKLLK
jgi:hypothetical protein